MMCDKVSLLSQRHTKMLIRYFSALCYGNIILIFSVHSKVVVVFLLMQKFKTFQATTQNFFGKNVYFCTTNLVLTETRMA